MSRTGRKNVSEKEFKALTALLGAGLSGGQIKSVTGRSEAVVSSVRKAQGDFEQYKDIQRVRGGKKEPVVAETEESTEVHKVHEDSHVDHDSNQRVLLALNRIGDQLERLADAWENTPGKRGLFK